MDKHEMEIDKVGLVARWGHNTLLAAVGLVTIAIVVILAK